MQDCIVTYLTKTPVVAPQTLKQKSQYRIVMCNSYSQETWTQYRKKLQDRRSRKVG